MKKQSKKKSYLNSRIYVKLILSAITVFLINFIGIFSTITIQASDPYIQGNDIYVLWVQENNSGHSSIKGENYYENVAGPTSVNNGNAIKWLSSNGGFDFSFPIELKGGTTYEAFVDKTLITNYRKAVFEVSIKNDNSYQRIGEQVPLLNDFDAENKNTITFTTSGDPKDTVYAKLKIILDAEDTNKRVQLLTKGNWGFRKIGENLKETQTSLVISSEELEPIKPLDPSNPNVDNPLEIEGTENRSPLSIDYVPTLNFEEGIITQKNKTYKIQPLILKDNKKKPHFVQITDRRGTHNGWKLGVIQSKPFTTDDNRELKRANIMIKNGVVKSTISQEFAAQKSSNNEFSLNNEKTILMKADNNKGMGTHLYTFGKNENEAEDSIQLTVPGSTLKLKEKYSTDLNWILEDTP